MGERATAVRMRLREEKDRQKMSTRDIAGILGWSQSRVGKILSGRVGLDLDDCESLCFALGIGLTEAVRDRGMEFCAEMTPTEMRLIEMWRKMGKDDRDAHWHIMTAHTKAALPESRRAAPQRVVRKRDRARG